MNFLGVKNSGSGIENTGIVASGQVVAFGTFVRRSADGYIKMVPTGTNVHGYLGIAKNDVNQHMYDGFYSAGETLPIIQSGSAYAWLLGGQVVYSGDYLKFPTALGAGTEGIGVLYPETTVTKTLDTVAKYIGRNDAGSADYDQTVSSISGDTLTIDSAAHLTALNLSEGDLVVIDSNEAAEVSMILDPAASTTTCTVTRTPLATHANAIKIYKLVQINVQMVD
jgi:hypothetical protein